MTRLRTRPRRLTHFLCEPLEDRVVPAFTFDTTFAGGGQATAHFGFGDDSAQAVAVDSQGRIIMAGWARVNADDDFAIVRLNPDGTRDASFGSNGNGRVTVDVSGISTKTSTDDQAFGVAVDGSDRIVVVGRSTIFGDQDFAVVRLNSNGSLDTSFSVDGIGTYFFGTTEADNAFGVALAGDRIYVCGTTFIGANYDFALLALDQNGNEVSSFGNSSKQGWAIHDYGFGDDTAFSIAVRGNGRIILGGSARIVADDDFAIAQFTSTGALDGSFGNGGSNTYDFELNNDAAYAMSLLSNGSVVMVGSAVTGTTRIDDDFAIVKFTANGQLDTSFGNSGARTYDFGFGADRAFAVAADSGGGFVVAGDALVHNDADFAALRFDGAGSIDTTFGTNGQLTRDFELDTDTAFAVTIQSDGKIVLVGEALIGGDTDFAAVRFSTVTATTSDSDGDGLLDTWETNGIDVNGDGTIDLNLAALGADPQALDLFIEVDAMTGRAPSTQVLNVVIAAFANAPVTINGRNGIRLHPIMSDTDIPVADWPQLQNGFPVGFDQTRQQFFGDPGERASANAANILAARNLAFRYCIFGNSYGGTGSSGVARDIVAQDFCVTLGPSNQVSVDALAGTFMHELGHTLGLRHHGNENLPNPSTDYLSIMNYRHQFGQNNTARDEVRLTGHPTYAANNSPVNPDWLRIVYNWRTGAGANLGFDVPRPAPLDDSVPTILPPTPAALRRFFVGADAGGTPTVSIRDSTGQEISQTAVFDNSFTGGVRTASADFNNDGVLDGVVATGPGTITRVRILDGATGAELAAFQPFEAAFTGGLYVAVGDVNADGRPDLIVTPDQGGGPVAAVYDGAKLVGGQSADASQIIRYLGIDDSSFRGGARPTLGDVTGDGRAEIIVSAGFLGGPRITIWDGTSIATLAPRQLANFFAFENMLRNGAFVSSGDYNGDGLADVAFGGGPGGGPRVRVFNGQRLLAAGLFGTLDEIEGAAQMNNFFAGDSNNRGGVRLASRDLTGDRIADLLTGAGSGAGSRVSVYAGTTLTTQASPGAADFNIDAFSGFGGGVFVG